MCKFFILLCFIASSCSWAIQEKEAVDLKEQEIRVTAKAYANIVKKETSKATKKGKDVVKNRETYMQKWTASLNKLSAKIDKKREEYEKQHPETFGKGATSGEN